MRSNIPLPRFLTIVAATGGDANSWPFRDCTYPGTRHNSGSRQAQSRMLDWWKSSHH
jgi:hypothetical protein